MTDNQYLDVSMQLSRLLTRRYSTSFSQGIRLFPDEMQKAIYGIYGFVRVADEIVDTFHDFDKTALLARFTDDTFSAIKEGISTNPVLNAFQAVVNQYGIDHALIEAFLRSMRMDLNKKNFTESEYRDYIFGSAEAVGLMCLKVFCSPDEAQYARLKQPACRLGSAFQKVNFLRDIGNDWEERGRIYLPGVLSWEDVSPADKSRMEGEIAREFAEAFDGIRQLPSPARLPVLAVFYSYQALFRKLQKHTMSELVRQRLRIPNGYKFLLLLRAFWTEKVLMKFRG